MEYHREIIEELIGRGAKREDVAKIKLGVARKYRLSRIPSNSEILGHAEENERDFLLPILKKKPVRSLSGITVVAVMAKPAPCPGECIYCPRGENAPQSYTGFEPAALRARANDYNPYLQVKERLNQLKCTGHSIDKVELIIMGGTFPSLEESYQNGFVTSCLDGMSNFPYEQEKLSENAGEAQERNERARVRCVGITFETRPDFARAEHVNRMLDLGATRVEIGVQTLSNRVYRKVKRGHSVEDVVEATRILKDAGLKVGYHMMPGLFASPEEDIEMFRKLFSNQDFKPDNLKIYPTLVIKDTELYNLWKKGDFTPYSSEEAGDLIAGIKALLPKWVRTMRIQRDIPANLIEAGVRKGDIADIALKKLKDRGKSCKCIRCRDIGHMGYKYGIESLQENRRLMMESYYASGGEEKFISIEDIKEDALIAYLRLRFPSDRAERSEVKDSAIVRELRVLGEALPLGKNSKRAEQHRGYGSELLSEAEKIASEEGFDRVLVISAIGTREYYSRLGYSRLGPYMAKSL